MRRGPQSVRVEMTLTRDVQRLLNRAITGGKYGSASEYVRALIVNERRRSGDQAALGVDPKVKIGRPRAA
jgi:Arc/MetJ-type ribon-helix-helix transcriptional regulator